MTIALLALGTGANTALFSVVDTVLLKPLPYADAGRLTSIYEASPAKDQKQSLIAPARIEDWNRMSRAFAAIAGAYSENVTDTSGSEPVRLAGRRVSPRYFEVFQSRPVLGRTFTSDEEIAGGRTAAVISYGLWTRSYGQSRDAIQRRLTIGGQGYGIVGVMPQDFSASAIDVWIPAQTPAFLMRARDARFYAGVGKMKAGITVAQAQEDLARVQRVLGEQFPKTDRGWSAQVQDLKEARVGGSRRALLLLFGAVGLLMLITITNVASLFLAELGKRERELAIRTSIGASRGQVIGEVMRETMLLAITGGLVGWGAAVLSLAALKKLFADIPRIEELHVDWRPLLFAVAMSVICAMLFGLMPALRATSAKHGGNLFRAGRGITGERRKLQRAMVMSQIAITLVLLASAGMLLRSFNNLSHVEMGFDASQAVTFHVGAAWDEDRARVGRLQERLIAGLQKIPGVTAAGMTNFLPASGATLRFTFQVDGKQGEQLGVRTVSPGYLQALRVPLLSGAPCPELRYDQKAPQKAMVNRKVPDHLWGGTARGGSGDCGRNRRHAGRRAECARVSVRLYLRDGGKLARSGICGTKFGRRAAGDSKGGERSGSNAGGVWIQDASGGSGGGPGAAAVHGGDDHGIWHCRHAASGGGALRLSDADGECAEEGSRREDGAGGGPRANSVVRGGRCWGNGAGGDRGRIGAGALRAELAAGGAVRGARGGWVEFGGGGGIVGSGRNPGGAGSGAAGGGYRSGGSDPGGISGAGCASGAVRRCDR